MFAVDISPNPGRCPKNGDRFAYPHPLGVEHYWIVDPAKQRVECHRLAGDAYRLAIDAADETELADPDWNGLVIDLTALWR